MAEEEQPQPRPQQLQQQAPVPTGFASFDAASFFAVQQAQEAARAEALRAAAEALLPTSSEEEDTQGSEAEAEGEWQDEAGRVAEDREACGGGAAERRGSDGRRHRRLEIERDKRKRRRRSRSRSHSKRSRGSSGAAAVARSDWAAAVEAERRKGPEARAAQVRGWAASETGLLKDPYYYDTR